MSRDYFEMLWRHVLVGARVRAVENGPKLSVLVLDTPHAAASINSETLRIELKSPGDLALWHRQNELIVAGGDFELEALPRDGGEARRLTLPAETTLGRVQTEAGKSLSQMKMASLARQSIEAETGSPNIELLHEVRDHTVSAAHQQLITAGFRGTAPIWVRNGEGCTQAVVLENSRFNTRFMISFWLNVYVLAGNITQTPRSFGALVAACGGRVDRERPPLTMFGVAAIDPAGIAVVEDAATYVRDVLVPWFDANRKA